jgi:hypothetical protein
VGFLRSGPSLVASEDLPSRPALRGTGLFRSLGWSKSSLAQGK